MSALAICIMLGLACACGAMVGWMLRNGESAEQRGRDLQRVDDIIELWRAMPDRDARGRFKPKERAP